jgi:hypothetical protein
VKLYEKCKSLFDDGNQKDFYEKNKFKMREIKVIEQKQ